MTVMLAKTLRTWVLDARHRTFELVEDLSDEQLLGPRLSILNPLLWEIGHVAWFQEKWVLRHACGRQPIRADADALYDSAAVPHDVRWDLLLPAREDTLAYLHEVRDRVLEQLESPDVQLTYFVLLSVFHEDMHGEAFTYTRQTLAYPAPRWELTLPKTQSGPQAKNQLLHLLKAFEPRRFRPEMLPGDVDIPGGTFLLGAARDESSFVFDNEKWAHPVEVVPFRIARAPVTQAEFAYFVEDGGYRSAVFWTAAGWRWRQSVQAEHPVYWQRSADGWLRRDFDQWRPLEAHRPVLHVNWFEADAYCRWAGRRLPTEVEWEVAAAAIPADKGQGLGARKRRFPWGADGSVLNRANLDGLARGCVDVAALPEGDSAFGCRQMIGNVWEWTSSDFAPYPGFEVDPYQEYSQPWFFTHKVLRGGCWVTRARLLRNTWRNFYKPDRRDVWAGFRTCALND